MVLIWIFTHLFWMGLVLLMHYGGKDDNVAGQIVGMIGETTD